MNDANEPGEAVNKGPNGGGSYRNANNSLEIGGETEPNEATSVTAETIAAMPTQDARGSIGGSQRAASDRDMSGGN
jgi:hypothetical protein